MTDRPAILMCSLFPEGFIAAAEARWEVIRSVADLTDENAPRVRGAVTIGSTGFDRALMDRLPNLGIVSCFGSGHENVDLAAARDHGVVATNSAGANAACVADFAMGLLLASLRRIAEADRFVRADGWVGRASTRHFLSTGLGGRRLGVLGLGAIGRQIARRAEGFDLEIGYHNRSRRSDVAYRYFDRLPALAEWADILMVACRADASNRNLVDGAILQALGPTGVVINIARGSVIDEPAMVRALESGTIAGAGLDVFVDEPEMPAALKSMDQVVLAPHIGGTTMVAMQAMGDRVLAVLEDFLAGRPVEDLARA